MNLRLEQYRIFNAVVEYGTFSKASEALFMTQSAVSQAIKQLENSIDMTLFKRTSKNSPLRVITVSSWGVYYSQAFVEDFFCFGESEEPAVDIQELDEARNLFNGEIY